MERRCRNTLIIIIIIKFRMTSTLTKHLEKSPSDNRDFPFTVRKELICPTFPQRSKCISGTDPLKKFHALPD